MAGSLETLGRALGPRYRVEREFARGGMATVYLARDTKHGRAVAVKVVGRLPIDESDAHRFLREIEVTATLQHPNILPLHDSGRGDDFFYYVMPFFDGATLADRLLEGPLGVDEAVRITRSVASALQYAHDAQVVHRDVKPSNILFQAGEAVVADFGIALVPSSAADGRLTETGTYLGTAAYMSPEQARGGEVDGRSDQYSLACVVHHMLAGSPPFPGTSFPSVMARHLTDPAPSLTTLRPSVGSAIARVVSRGLSKDPGERYASVAAFADALAKAARGRSLFPISRVAAAFGGVLAVLALTASGVWWLTRPEAEVLDPSRIVVFPLVSGGTAGGPSAGEDLATSIGHALDGTASLRWIDGWTLLDADDRTDVRGLSHDEARALTRGRGSRYFVTGRLLERGDTTEVLLDLVDTAGDSVAARSQAAGPSDRAWRVALVAANGLLPSLLESEPPGFARDLFERTPQAVANFLLAERLFRRARGTDALAAYRAAFAADSTFALAAMRGARAATWEHRPGEALDMVEAAMGLPLSERDRLYGQGLRARLAGDADTATYFFEAVIAADSAFSEGWSQLGETFRHLSPKRPDPTAMIVVSMRRALETDPTATHALFHLIEEEIRGAVSGGSDNLERFLAGGPDARLSRGLRVAGDCVARPDEVDLEEAVRANPEMTNTAAWLAAGGKQLDCSERLFRAILARDTADEAAAGRVNAALTGLHAVLVARGKTDEALSLLDSARVSTDAARRFAAGTLGWERTSPPSWDRETRLRARHLVVLDEIIGIDAGTRSSEVAREDLAEWGGGYRDAYPDDLYRRAVWEAWRGDLDAAVRFGRALEGRAASAPERVRVLSAALPGHLALARGDSATALRVFSAARPRAPSANLSWHFGYAMGLERLLEARLLLAEGRHREAMEVASVLDGHPIMYVLYLRPSLEVRAQAAQALGEGRLADAFRQRLAALDR